MRGHRYRRPRGTIVALFLVLVSVLITALITTMALTSGSQAQLSTLTFKRDQAFFAAEAGIQRALWMAKYGNWAGQGYSTLTGATGDASYSVVKVSSDGLGRVVIRSTGTLPASSVPNSSLPVSISISGTLDAAFPMPAIQLGGSFSGGGGAHVTGNMMTTGSISHNGNFSVDGGNVYAGSTISASIDLDAGYALYPNFVVPPAPDVQAIADSLSNNPAAKAITSTSQLDFSQSSAGILVYHGSISSWRNPNVLGDGTLVVYGDVSIKSMSSFTGHNVNLVVVGSLSALGGSKFDLQGSLYVLHDIGSQSQFSVQGIVLCDGNMDTQGQGSDVSLLPPPWFDPRLASPLGGRIISKFTGPIF
jgi:hypothetical protein